MRLLIAHSFYRQPGGEDRYVHQQVELLGRTHEVALVGYKNDELTVGARTALRMTYSRNQAQIVDEAVTAFRPSVIHLHNAYPSLGPAVHLAVRRHRLPLVLTVHNYRMRCPNGLQFTEGGACRRCEAGLYANAVVHHCFASRAQAAAYASALWFHRFVLRLERDVTLFIAPSDHMRGRLVTWGIPEERIVVVRNFTDLELGSAEPGSYGLYLGRLVEEKGLDVLLQALAAAGDPPFRIAGDGPARESLEVLAASLRLRNTVFLGQLERDAVEPVLRASRYVVFPSLWDENAPMAALEALTTGRPIVVTRAGGLPELVSKGGGLVVQPRDVDGLAHAILTLVGGEELCRTEGAIALATALAEFRPDAHRRKLEDAYDRAVAMTARLD